MDPCFHVLTCECQSTSAYIWMSYMQISFQTGGGLYGVLRRCRQHQPTDESGQVHKCQVWYQRPFSSKEFEEVKLHGSQQSFWFCVSVAVFDMFCFPMEGVQQGVYLGFEVLRLRQCVCIKWWFHPAISRPSHIHKVGSTGDDERGDECLRMPLRHQMQLSM